MDTYVDRDLAELAKGIVVFAFRNGPLEDIHAGKVCPTCEGDSSYSHITQDEMRTLMKFAVDHIYVTLVLESPKQRRRLKEAMLRYAQGYAGTWDDPAPIGSGKLGA